MSHDHPHPIIFHDISCLFATIQSSSLLTNIVDTDFYIYIYKYLSFSGALLRLLPNLSKFIDLEFYFFELVLANGLVVS